MADSNNYLLGEFQNPIDSFNKFYKMGSDIATRQAEALAAEQKAKEEAERAAKAQVALDRLDQPDATYKDYMYASQFVGKEYAEALQKTAAEMKTDERNAMLVDASRLYAAFKAGNIPVAKSLMEKQAEADRLAGNTKEAAYTETLISLLEDPVGVDTVKKLTGFTLAALPGGKDAFDAIERAEKIEDVEEDRDAVIKQYAADLNLTEAQTNELIARTKKLEAETAKIIADMMAKANAPGGLDPDLKPEFELKLNTAYNTRIKGYTKAMELGNNVIKFAQNDDPVSDMSLIYNYMHMLDESSVVRESEYAQAESTRSVVQHYRLLADKFKEGDKLRPEQRAKFAELTKELLKSAAKGEAKVRADLGFLVKNYGLNPDNVFGTMANKPGPNEISNNVDVTPELRAFLKSEWPKEAADIDKLSDAEILKKYPKTISRYTNKSTPSNRVEVDY